MTTAEKVNCDRRTQLEKQIKLNKMEIQELKTENQKKDDEVKQLKFQDSLSMS